MTHRWVQNVSANSAMRPYRVANSVKFGTHHTPSSTRYIMPEMKTMISNIPSQARLALSSVFGMLIYRSGGISGWNTNHPMIFQDYLYQCHVLLYGDGYRCCNRSREPSTCGCREHEDGSSQNQPASDYPVLTGHADCIFRCPNGSSLYQRQEYFRKCSLGLHHCSCRGWNAQARPFLQRCLCFLRLYLRYQLDVHRHSSSTYACIARPDRTRVHHETS